MPLFDRYIAVDWSAASKPKTGKDSIWIADSDGNTTNPPTRAVAVADVAARFAASRIRGEAVFAGFDFPFGYPAGAALAITGHTGWQSLWSFFAASVTDDRLNVSNRFVVGGAINDAMAADGPRFWGHHKAHSFSGMTRTRPPNSHIRVNEKRIAEVRARTAQPVWKLFGIGSVGSQAMLGIAWLQRLRTDPALQDAIAIWPFETAFADKLQKPIVIAEIYPSIVKVASNGKKPKDQVQVETMVELFASADARDEFTTMLDAPSDLTSLQKQQAIDEEGWIVGLGP